MIMLIVLIYAYVLTPPLQVHYMQDLDAHVHWARPNGKPVSGTALFQHRARRLCNLVLAALPGAFASAAATSLMKETWRESREPACAYLECT